MSLARQLSYHWQRHVRRRDRLRVDGLPFEMQFWVPTRDDVGRRLFKYRMHEAPVFDWLQSLPAPEAGAIALDVGANLGWYSVLLDRLGAGRLAVHAFEPDPDNVGLLRENLSLNACDSVSVNAFALADETGETTLYRYRDINRGKHSLVPMDGVVDEITVHQTTLDDYLAEAGLETAPVWLLKLDVEGLEAAVLQGARRCLSRVHAVVMEYSPVFYAGDEGQAVLDALAEAGLTPSLWNGDAWSPLEIDKLRTLKGQFDTVWS